MIEIFFLVILALTFMIFAVFVDLKYRIVPNWLNFSLIVFALVFRFFYSLFNSDFDFFLQGFIGLGIFFVLGNALYYSRMFAGGDAKLMIALGIVLPFSDTLFVNLQIFLMFFTLFLFSGAIYGLAWSGFLFSRNFKACKKEITKQFSKNKKLFYLTMLLGIVILFYGFNNRLFFYLGAIVFLLPSLYVFAKAVDEKCLVRKMKTKDLGEGEWLYRDLKIGNKMIKAKWEGVTKEEIKMLRKKFKEILIREGIPFSPVFLISFVLLVWFYFKGINLMSLI